MQRNANRSIFITSHETQLQIRLKNHKIKTIYPEHIEIKIIFSSLDMERAFLTVH